MNEAQEDQIRQVIRLYLQIEDIISSKAKVIKALEFSGLVLSVLTSGGLWLLVSQLLPTSTLWVGATISTVATGITLYINAAGLNWARSRALGLHRRTGTLLASVRAKALDPERFWNELKVLENDYMALLHGRQEA